MKMDEIKRNLNEENEIKLEYEYRYKEERDKEYKMYIREKEMQDKNDRKCEEGRRCEERRRMGSVSNFIQRAYALLEDERNFGIVGWVYKYNNAFSFQVQNVREFETVVLPRYFKHSNLSSFVRQLNMYDFHKVRGDRHDLEFYHEKFRRDCPELLCQIKRKQTDSTSYISSQPLIRIEAENGMLKGMPNKEEGEDIVKGKKSSNIWEEKAKEYWMEREEYKRRDYWRKEYEYRAKEEWKGNNKNIYISEDVLQRKLIYLQYINRSRRKTKASKMHVLQCINQQNKILINTKFTKVLMSLLASKVKQETHGFPKSEYLNPPPMINKMHLNDLIYHILDASDSLSFLEYSYSTDALFTTSDA